MFSLNWSSVDGFPNMIPPELTNRDSDVESYSYFHNSSDRLAIYTYSPE
jgi:hypothetical protein